MCVQRTVTITPKAFPATCDAPRFRAETSELQRMAD